MFLLSFWSHSQAHLQHDLNVLGSFLPFPFQCCLICLCFFLCVELSYVTYFTQAPSYAQSLFLEGYMFRLQINTNSGTGSVGHPVCKVQNSFLSFISFPQPSSPTRICYPGWSHCVSSLTNTIHSIKARSFHQGGQRLGCDV